jgi:heme-degrading monooxygenase HmoA
MFVRVAWYQSSPDQVEQRLAAARQGAARLASLPGYRGLTTCVDRSSGAGVGVTSWDSAAAMEASEEAGASVRSQFAGRQLYIREVDRFDVLVQERTAPPQTNTFVRINDLHGPPRNVDELATFVREQAPAVLKAQPGFRAVLLGAHRQIGRVLIASVWDTAA